MNIFIIFGIGCLIYFGITLLYILSENISYQSYKKDPAQYNPIILFPIIIINKIIDLLNK